MGMELEDFEDGAELLAGPVRIFLDPGPRSAAVFELLAPNLDDAHSKLKFYGYDVLVWNGVGGANIVRDPFGMLFNVFEFDDADVIELNLGEHDLFRATLGAVTNTPKQVSEFYSMVLQQPANKLTDGSYLLGNGDVSFRVRPGESNVQVLWLSHFAPVDVLLEAGCSALEDDQSVFRDPFGLVWAIETRIQSSHAVVHPL